MDTAFAACKEGRFNSGLACCRAVYEIGVNCWWCLADDTCFEKRATIWHIDTLCQRKKIVCGLAEMRPAEKDYWLNEANKYKKEIEKQKKDLSDELKTPNEKVAKNKLPSMPSRVQTLMNHTGRKSSAPSLYPLYRILSASVHPQLDFDSIFKHRGPATVMRSKPEMPGYTPLLTVACAYLLVFPVRDKLGWCTEQLFDEYQELAKYCIEL